MLYLHWILIFLRSVISILRLVMKVHWGKNFIISHRNSLHSWFILGLLDSPSEFGPIRVKFKWKTSINREWDSLFGTHTHSTLAHEWERRSSHKLERKQLLEIIFVFLGFTFAIGAHSISEEVARFSPLWFPWGKLFVSLVSCDYWCACYSLR